MGGTGEQNTQVENNSNRPQELMSKNRGREKEEDEEMKHDEMIE